VPQHSDPNSAPESVTIPVTLPSAEYPVHIGAGLLSSLGAIVHVAVPRARRVLLVQDSGVPSHTRLIAAHALATDFTVTESILTASEPAKSIDTLGTLWGALADGKLDRDDVVVALGGGIITDVAGFAAATYRRGIPIVQCPTTLLSMVDASVGGKTGINLPSSRGILKNMAGSFHQPAAVVADVSTLLTLSPREYRAGLAEVIKHALIERSITGSSNLLDLLTSSFTRFTTPVDLAALTDLIAANIRIKAAVVALDERETAPDAVGGRALLNLGHTFAHAIEPLAQLSPTGNPSDAPLKHGEAVGLGLVAAASTARHLGLIDAAYQSQIGALIQMAGLPCEVGGLPDDATLLGRMALDKKVRGGLTRLILPTGPGTAAVFPDVASDAIAVGWSAIRR
jgi:3-dehydroquinate synthetase